MEARVDGLAGFDGLGEGDGCVNLQIVGTNLNMILRFDMM